MICIIYFYYCNHNFTAYWSNFSVIIAINFGINVIEKYVLPVRLVLDLKFNFFELRLLEKPLLTLCMSPLCVHSQFVLQIYFLSLFFLLDFLILMRRNCLAFCQVVCHVCLKCSQLSKDTICLQSSYILNRLSITMIHNNSQCDDQERVLGLWSPHQPFLGCNKSKREPVEQQKGSSHIFIEAFSCVLRAHGWWCYFSSSVSDDGRYLSLGQVHTVHPLGLHNLIATQLEKVFQWVLSRNCLKTLMECMTFFNCCTHPTVASYAVFVNLMTRENWDYVPHLDKSPVSMRGKDIPYWIKSWNDFIR